MFVDVKYLFDVVSIDLFEVSCYWFELFLIKMEEWDVDVMKVSIEYIYFFIDWIVFKLYYKYWVIFLFKGCIKF